MNKDKSQKNTGNGSDKKIGGAVVYPFVAPHGSTPKASSAMPEIAVAENIKLLHPLLQSVEKIELLGDLVDKSGENFQNITE